MRGVADHLLGRVAKQPVQVFGDARVEVGVVLAEGDRHGDLELGDVAASDLLVVLGDGGEQRGRPGADGSDGVGLLAVAEELGQDACTPSPSGSGGPGLRRLLVNSRIGPAAWGRR